MTKGREGGSSQRKYILKEGRTKEEGREGRREGGRKERREEGRE